MADNVNVLVIEDNKDDAIFLEKTLIGFGYQIWVAGNGKEGVKLAQNVSFAAVLTELRMPRMNGVDIAKKMTKLNPHLSVVVITAYSFIDSAVSAMQEGAYAYITKPFNIAEIKIVLERAVERHFLMSSGRERERLAVLSVKDGLTGVYNRRFLDIYAANKISIMKRSIEKLSIMMVDIDYFKQYNDTHGHLAGDELLKKLCKLFQEAVRQEDIVFRYGGEEFAILLDHTDKRSATLVAERIRTAVNLYIPTTISIGISTYPDDGRELESLLVKADVALYKAKEGGRNKICLA